MRVLQVVPVYYPATVYGGPIFSIHYACQALARDGIDVRVTTTNANGGTKLDVPTDRVVAFEPNYHVRYYDETIIGRFSWTFMLNLWHDIRAADIIHLQDIFSASAALTLLHAAMFRKPILVSARGTFTPWGLVKKRPWLKKAWLQLLVRPFVRNSQRVAWHATVESEQDEILSVFPGSRVRVIPNGIDCGPLENVNTLSRTKYMSLFFPSCTVLPEEATVMVGMGRLHKKKSFDTAIRAFHIVANAHPKSVLLIAGADDGEREPLKRLIAELGLDDRVALVGEVKGSDKIVFLKGADLFLFPSHSENFGMVALEAMAAWLPVVASRNTPWAELEEMGSGLWVENTPEAFARAIDNLFSRDLTPMRAKAHNHAVRYDLTTVASAFQDTYRELINDQKK